MRSTILVLLVTATLIQSTRVSLPCTARDFTPQTCSDFGRSSYSSDNNIPRSSLDHDNKPCQNSGYHSTVQSLQTFAQWFRDTQGVNRNLPVNLDCNHNDNTGVTSYYNNQFWPCDNRGYGNYGNTGHNCHYTTEHHHQFCYTGGEHFNCTSNSDVFVYIAGKLVINFGGVTSERTGNCRLDDLGLTKGVTYTVSIFHAQRDTRSCSFGFSTDCNIHNPVCPTSSTTGKPAAPLTTGSRPLTTGRALPLTTGRALPSTTGAITSSALSTAAITSSALTTAAITSAALTTAAMTTSQVTSSQLTTAAITSASWTSAAITSAAITSAAITSAALSTAALTTQALTTAALTTSALTTAALTTQEISSGAITSQALTTGSVPTPTPPAASTTGYVSPPPTPGNNNYTNNVTEPGRCIYICEVEFCNFCPGVALNDLENCPAAPILTFANGKNETFDQFNAISFGSFYTTLSGDVEGRIAVRNNLGLPNGAYSVGYEIRSGGAAAIDAPQPFSVVVGHDATWTSGAVYPLGNNIPYEAPQEFMYVGGSFTGPQDLKDVVVSGSSLGMNSQSLDAAFDQARAYYVVVGNSFNTGVNVGGSVSVDSTGLFTLTCDSTSTLSVSVQVTGSQITATNTWAKVNCADQVQIVFNIIGSDDFTFSGNNLNHRNERVLYNILGSRTVTVKTEVRGNMLMPSAILNQESGVIKGIVIAVDIVSVLQINRDNCVVVGQPPIVPPETVICPAYETQCEGLIFPLKGNVYSFRDFNVISFNNFVGKSGDVEGRVAARNNCDCLGGYSVGYQLSTAGGGPDNSLPYSLVCGQDLNFPGGAVYPDGSGVPHAGAQEYIFTGRNFTGPAYLAAQVTGSCANEQAGCLDQYFDAAESCYAGYSNSLASLADNTVTQYYWSGMFINCTSNSSSQYVVSVDAKDLSGATYYVTNNCNFQAQWVINVRGTTDVEITGGSFPGVPGGIVYNILGSRNIYVHDTDLVGNVLAPSATLNMTTGVINGKVVVGNVVNSLQINREGQCPVPTSVTVATVSTNSCPAGSKTIYVANPLAFQINDAVNDKDNNTYTITGIYPNSVSVNPPLVRLIAQQELLHFVANTAAARTMVGYNATTTDNNNINGSEQLVASILVMLIMAILI